MKLTHSNTDSQLRVLPDDDGQPSRTITGYAIVFDQRSLPLFRDARSETREMIAPEAVSADMLAGQDIRMLIDHDTSRLLARSRQGTGTLSYDVDKTGVRFQFDAPHTADGDAALELVRRGDLCGCSFAFRIDDAEASISRGPDEELLAQRKEGEKGPTPVLLTVRHIDAITDFTLTAFPAYPDTAAWARCLGEDLAGGCGPGPAEQEAVRAQVKEMRRAAAAPLNS